MPQSASRRHELAQRWGFVALSALALLLAARAAWLAGQAEGPPQPTVAAVVDSPRTPERSERPQVAAPTRLTEREYAAIAGLCPSSLAELPPEMVPLSAQRVPTEERGGSAVPHGRLTGIRLASREPSRGLNGAAIRVAQVADAGGDGWLVSPDSWFVPEDRPPEEGKPVQPAPEVEAAAPPRIEPQFPSPPEPLGAPAEEQEPAAPPTPEPLEAAAPEAATPSPPTIPFGSTGLGELIEEFGEGTDRPETEKQGLTPPEPIVGPSSSAPVFAPPGVAAPAVDRSPGAAEESSAPHFPAPATPKLDAERAWDGPFDAVAPKPEAVVEAPEPSTEPKHPEPVLSAPVAPPSETSASVPAREREVITAPPVTPPKPKAVFAPPRSSQPAAPTPAAPQPAAHPGGGAQAAAEAREAAAGKTADESHRELFAKNCYPSAQECAACHQKIYDEWSVSSHAYAFVSPMFHRFEQTISKLSQGTVGHFCVRCHSPVGTAMYEARSTPYDQMIPAAQEGVTCIVCHRVNQRWGKSNGDRRIVPGDIHAPVYGGVGGDGVAQAIADKKSYKVKTSPHEKGPGQAIHTEGRFFDQLTQAEACTSCHQVAVHPGIKLEVVWEQYRASPACKKGVTCQECHMGRIPGMAGGYTYGPIAEMNGKTVNNHRKQSSHIFYGPGYSIAHPGVFPQHKDAGDWTFAEWMRFDWRAGWGTDEFEEKIEEQEDRGVDTAAWFPEVWSDPDDRYDARDIIDDNLERLKTKRRYRELVMENGSHVDGPFFRQPPRAGFDLKFDYVVANKNEGHNLPTASLGAQPQLWANVVLIGPRGQRLWESGYTDSNGDLCDIHSVDVREGRAPFDKQLFNLQTMFLITGASGTDREFYLPVNFSFDQVPHLRPGTTPYTVSNHPPFIRMESRSLAPLGKKRVKYTVPGELMRERGRYRLSFRLRNRTEPMYFMRLCQSTPEMLRSMTEGTLDIHPQSVEFEVR